MKRIKYIFTVCVIACLCGTTSCSYLDVEPYFKDMMQYDAVFKEKKTTEEWLWSTYWTLKGYGVGTSYDPLTFSSDEAVYTDAGSGCEIYQNGTYSSMNMMVEGAKWEWFYIGIRKASIFIANVDQCTEVGVTNADRAQMKAEARFLRAYFYWILMKQFGPVVLMPEGGQDVSLSYEELALPRATFDECVEYVVSELELAARYLLPIQPTAWYGRATIGAALAVRAQVLLYAASPLYNGNSELFSLKNAQGEPLINQTESNKKWGRAAAAAKEIMSLGYQLHTVARTSATPPLAKGVPDLPFPHGAGNIDPFESYRQCFNGETSITRHPEQIFFRQNYPGDINTILHHSFPLTHRGANNLSVTLKQVDAYYMRDGHDIHNSSDTYPYVTTGFTNNDTKDPYAPTDVSMMFTNREPRFYASISYNNCIWENLTASSAKQNFRVNYYRTGGDGKQLSRPYDSPMTGIGIKKYYNPEDSWDDGGRVIHKVELSFRYADVLLWYAEALNELTDTYSFPDYLGNTQITVSRNTTEMQMAFSQIRFRAGIPDLEPAEYEDYEVFKSKLKRERQIEFFLEGARYFDLRRWKDAAVEENQPIMGMNVDMKSSSGQKERFYVASPVALKKVFMPKMYLWPFSDAELKKNAKLIQNPGW